MKKTFLELKKIDDMVGFLYKKNPALKSSKFGYAYKRFSDKNYIPTYKLIREELEDAQVEHALEDEKTKELLRDVQGNFKYSRDGQIKLLKSNRKINLKFDEKNIEIESYIIPEEHLPELSEEERDMLKGLLIDENSEAPATSTVSGKNTVTTSKEVKKAIDSIETTVSEEAPVEVSE